MLVKSLHLVVLSAAVLMGIDLNGCDFKVPAPDPNVPSTAKEITMEQPTEPLPEQPAVKPADELPQTEAEWKKKLTREQFVVLRRKGTERAFTGKYDHFFEAGLYKCAGCGNTVFVSDDKYNSGCGWPAFSSPAEQEAVKESRDTSHGMIRTEITCSKCGGHLGHVFNDGPGPAGLRYCINSAALEFEEKEESD